MPSYEQEVNKIKEQNKPLIDDFLVYLRNSGISSKTIKSHIDNIGFFEEYLVYYEPFQSLYEVDSSDVGDFLCDFFPRKAMWASPTSVKSYIATFKKFFKYLVTTNKIDSDEYDDLLEVIKDEKEDWLNSVEFDEEDCW